MTTCPLPELRLGRTVTAMGLLVSAAVIVLQLRIGPVVAVVSAGHGIHTGDLLGMAAAIAGLGLLATARSATRAADRVPGRPALRH